MDRKKDSHLNQLFVKLGHELEDIRQRALTNLLSKLDSNLVSSEELSKEKYLHVRLLGWFTFPNWSLSQEVLLLIKRLIHHNEALESFAHLNAFAVLSSLKVKLDGDSQLLVDDILDCLLKVQNIQPFNGHGGCEFYAKPLKTELSDEVSTSQDDVTFSSDSARHHHHHYRSDILDVARCSSCFSNSYFPWIGLTSTDKYVLNTTFESLSKGKSTKKSDQCNFVSDVLLQDFPAEVFLQRPQIIKALIDLISHKQLTSLNEVETKLLLESITVLTDLCHHLHSRIHFHEDRDFFYPASLQNDSNSKNPPSETRLTRHSDSMEQLDDPEWKQLHEHEWSLQEFCFTLLERIAHLLTGLDMTTFSKCSMLLSGIIKLLKRSVDKSSLWKHDHQDFKKRIASTLKTYAALATSQHRLKMSKFAASEATRRQSFFVVLSIVLFDLVESLVDLDEMPITFQQEIFACFKLMHDDVFIEIGLPSLFNKIGSVLESSDANYVKSDQYNVNKQSDELISSLRNCRQFLNANLRTEDANKSDLLRMAERGLLSLHQHRSLDFIEGSIRLASTISSQDGGNDSDIFKCRTLILNLLAYPDVSLQIEVYKILQKLTKDTLNVEKFVSSKPNFSNVLECLFDTRIFYEIIAFGFNNLNAQIHDMSRDLLLRLLQSKLLLPSDKWNKLTTCMEPLLPLLHSYGENSSLLGKCILGMFGEDSGATNISKEGKELEMIKGNMRMMFHKDSRLRKMGLNNSLQSLMCEENGSKKLPQLSSPDIFQLEDLFMVSCDFQQRWNYFNYSIYKESDLIKVISNFISPSVDIQVKVSSSSQISIMLCDPSLHKTFLSSSGLQLIVKELQEALFIQNHSMMSQSEYKSLVSNLMKCLLSLVILNSEVCEKLSSDASFHLMLIRYGLMFASENAIESHIDVSIIVFLTLFRQVSGLIVSWHVNELPMVDDNTVRIPVPVSLRYHVPFENSCDYCKCSPWETENLLKVADERMNERMRAAWGVATCDVAEACREEDVDQARFNEALVMRDDDREMLRASVPHAAVSFAFSELEHARDHFSASRSILRISTFVSFRSRDLEAAFPIGWMKALEKFISVAPSSPSDFLLLQDVIQFLRLILTNISSSSSSSSSSIDHREQVSKVRDWMMKHILDDAIVSLILMKSNEEPIKRHILQLINQLISLIEFNSTAHKDGLSNLTKIILTQIPEVELGGLTGLSLLVKMLTVLNHVTARSGWSKGDFGLCNEVLQILLKNCSSLIHCSTDMRSSYVGRGMMKFASSSLNNVANEMIDHHHGDDWLKHWSCASPTSENVDDDKSAQKYVDSGFDWLFSIITYRDVEVCSSGLSIATTLCSTMSGCNLLTNQVSSCHLQNIWEVALQILIDEAECYFVRRQATCLLLNLMSHLGSDSQMQNLVVHDAKMNVRLVGMPCLIHLLRETKFYEMFASILNSFHLESTDGCRLQGDQEGQSRSGFSSRLSQMSDITEGGGGIKHSQAPPSFVSCLCDLLQNVAILSPSETMQDVRRHGIVKSMLRSLTSSMATVQYKINDIQCEINKWTFFFTDSLDLMTSFIDFVTILVDQDEVLKDALFMKHLPLAFKFFNVFAERDCDEGLKRKSMRLVRSCMDLLVIILRSNDNSFRIISKVCDERWPAIRKTLVRIISEKDIFGTDLWFSCLQFVTTFASEELKHSTPKNIEEDMTSMLSKNLASSGDGDSVKFDEAMMMMIQSFNFKSFELFHHKLVVLEAIKSLLMLSPSFRMKAFQAGLVSLIIDHLQRLSSSFSVESDSNVESNKKKTKPLLQETQLTLEVLHGLMFQSPEAKMSACRRDLSGLMCGLWRWCLVFRSLMSRVLSMLTCFASNCPSAVSTMITPSNKQPSVSLFINVVKFLHKEFSSAKGNDYSLLQKAFQLLENLVINSECRSLLAKSTFLADMSSLVKSRNKKQNSQSTEEILWLKFLTGLSFFGEGQLMILKNNDILNILLECGDTNINKTSHQLSVLVVRNLCFHPNNKPKLLSNDKVLNFLFKCLNDKSDQLVSVTCSALLELLSSNQKFRTQLKNNYQVRKRLQDLLERQNSKQTKQTDPQKWNLKQALYDIIIIIDS